MKYLLLSVVIVLLIIEPCNSFSLVVDNLLAHPYSPYLLGGLGTAVCILPACYIFYPAYANVEGGLGCTSTVLAGNDNKNNQGKSISYDAPTFAAQCIVCFHSHPYIITHCISYSHQQIYRQYTFTCYSCLQ